jgi:hypothetical protein
MTVQKAGKDKRPEPGPKTKARAADAKQRIEGRMVRLKTGVTRPKERTLELHSPHTDDSAWHDTLLDAFGTSSEPFATAEIKRLAYGLQNNDQMVVSDDELNAALAAVDGARPENETAAMLASQMALTHSLAMALLGRTRRAELLAQFDSAGSLAVKLLRTFTAQVEALAKLKRGGEQVVRVEHVHVYPGGQAIVGTVTNHRGEGGVADGKCTQADGASDARALAFAPSAAMFGPDAGRDALPEGRSDRQETLPDARRSSRQRRASR